MQTVKLQGRGKRTAQLLKLFEVLQKNLVWIACDLTFVVCVLRNSLQDTFHGLF